VQGGQTALMAASMEGHHQVVEVLLKAEAKPDMQSKVFIFISTQWNACRTNTNSQVLTKLQVLLIYSISQDWLDSSHVGIPEWSFRDGKQPTDSRSWSWPEK